jgi:phospholipid/cholesterol/gamma-HCH transport system substrate-binding protein
MLKNISTVRLGLFVTLGIVLLIIGIFMIGQKNSMFSSTFVVNAYFKDVQGLKSGAPVRLGGIDVGSVKNIEIVKDTSGRVEVSMNLQTDIKRFIKTDTKASIENEGLVGNKVVVLTIGSSLAEAVKDGGFIQSVEPVGFSAIITQTQGVMQYTKEMTKNLSEIVGKVNNGEGSIGKLVNNDELYISAVNLTKRADESLKDITDELNRITNVFDSLGVGVGDVVINVNHVVKNVNDITASIKEGRSALGALLVTNKYDSTITSTLQNIELTSKDARLSASRLAENMEALKHNWLFKGYFENRGYWDKAEYEDQISSKLKELDEKIKILNDKIEILKKLEKAK